MERERCLCVGRRARSVLAISAILMGGLAGCSSENVTPSESTDPAVNESPALAASPHVRVTWALSYHDSWRKLWEDHITWTRMVIIGVFDSLPGSDHYVSRLLQNYEDMEDALAPYYGEDAAEEFGELLKEHLTIAAEILGAAKAGDSERVDRLVESWRENADALATQMNEMNPSHWSLDETRAMWREHLDVTLVEATTHLAGDFAGELASWERVHDGALMMADLFSHGVIRQFPRSFAASGRFICSQG